MCLDQSHFSLFFSPFSSFLCLFGFGLIFICSSVHSLAIPANPWGVRSGVHPGPPCGDQTGNHSCSPTAKLEPPINRTCMSLYCGKKPRRYREHTERLPPTARFKQSCCEAIVWTTAPLCHLNLAWYLFFYFLLLSRFRLKTGTLYINMEVQTQKSHNLAHNSIHIMWLDLQRIIP